MQEKYIKPKKNFIVRLSGKRDRFLQRLYIYDWTYIFRSQRRGVQLLRLCFCDFCFGFIPESESFTKISQFSKKWVYFLKCHNFFSEGASELKFSRKIWEVSEFPRKLSLLHFYMFHISISSKVDHPLNYNPTNKTNHKNIVYNYHQNKGIRTINLCFARKIK